MILSLCYDEPSRRAEAPGNITIVSMPSIREETSILARAVEETIWRYDTSPPDPHLTRFPRMLLKRVVRSLYAIDVRRRRIFFCGTGA